MKYTFKHALILFLGISILFTTGCKKQLNQTPKYGLNSEVIYGDPSNYINVLAKFRSFYDRFERSSWTRRYRRH